MGNDNELFTSITVLIPSFKLSHYIKILTGMIVNMMEFLLTKHYKFESSYLNNDLELYMNIY